MPKQQTDYLIQLIKSLTKAEKRYFKLFVNRNQASEDILFLRLFELLDKQKNYDEALILRKIQGIKKRQLSNIKAHLYKQLLLCLRLLHRSQNQDIEIRERIDYAKVLYNKGLYRQSLEILDKAKVRALHHEQHTLGLEILEFEKLIESQYIPQRMNSRAEKLTEEADRLRHMVSRSHLFSNLALQLYSLYLKVGYVRSQKEYHFIREFFMSNLPKYDEESMSFYEKLYLYQSYCWFCMMTQDFLYYYRYAQKWVDLFQHNRKMMELETALYLKGLNNLLTSLFLLWHHNKFAQVLSELENLDISSNAKQATNVQSLHQLFKSIHQINRHYMEGTFSDGLALVPELVRIIDQEVYLWDEHRVMVLYYKIACLYFGSGDNENAIHYLNLVINKKSSDIRGDIQCFSRILCLIAHFELGNDILVEYQIKSVYRFLIKMEDLHAVQQEILKFLRKLPRIQRSDLKAAFIRLRNDLSKLRSAPFERRPFLYLDIISWLESKIEGETVQNITKRKFSNNYKPLSVSAAGLPSQD
ncbi:MAG: hypothetical protein AAFP19_19655 [Bacteroidota bacterium]